MKTAKPFLGIAVLLVVFGLFSGCESTGGGDVYGSGYYGVGFYDPWYYGPSYYPPGVIVVPPPHLPSHPISIPSVPRPMPMRR